MSFIDTASPRLVKTHFARSSFVVNFPSLIYWIHLSLVILKYCFKDLKTPTSRSCRACKVWLRSVIKSRPYSQAFNTTSYLTWLPCSSKINNVHSICEMTSLLFMHSMKWSIHFEKKMTLSMPWVEVSLLHLICIVQCNSSCFFFLWECRN